MKPLVLTVVALLLGFSSPAPVRVDLSTTTNARWSGAPGNLQADWSVSSGDFAISGLETAESLDKPCRMGVMFKGMPGTASQYRNYDTNYGEQQINIQCSLSMSDWIPSRRRAGFFAANRRYVAAAAVCTNSRNGRVKGLRVYPARVLNSGQVEHLLTQTREFERQNCNDWKRASICPADKVATGVIAGFNQRGIVGIRLQCSAVITE